MTGLSSNTGVTADRIPRRPLDHLPKIYIAGPDVFHETWPTFARQVQQHAWSLGLEAILPVPAMALRGPGVTETGTGDQARAIALECKALIRRADGLVANLNPFRSTGTEPDSGTVFEIGQADARSIPIVGYLKDMTAMDERLGPALDGVPLWDQQGYFVERFGSPLNAMLIGACTTLVCGTVQDALRQIADYFGSACPTCSGTGVGT